MKHSILGATALAIVTLAAPQACSAEPGSPGDLPAALHLYSSLDYSAALPILFPLAHEGDAVAQEILGFMFLIGEGVSRDEPLALYWFKLAAKAGRMDAQFELGEMYRKGVGTQIDRDAALLWLRRAADQGSVAAFEGLAQYYWGEGACPVDAAAALQSSFEAARRGSSIAMYDVGLHYAAGLNVTRDDIEALMWLDLASNLAIGTLHDDVLRAKSAVAEGLMPGQVQIALRRSADWWRKYIGK